MQFRSSRSVTHIVFLFAEYGFSDLLLGLVNPSSSFANFGFIGMANSAIDNVLHVQRRKFLPSVMKGKSTGLRYWTPPNSTLDLFHLEPHEFCSPLPSLLVLKSLHREGSGRATLPPELHSRQSLRVGRDVSTNHSTANCRNPL